MSEKAKESEEEFIAFKCPACQSGDIVIKKAEYELPDQDKMLIIKFECNKCAYHKNDVIPLTTRMEAGIITLRVTDENDLKSKIYRSPTGKLELIEFDLEVEPGPAADFYYTNVEGILYRFEGAVRIYYNNLKESDPEIEKIEDILHNLQKAMNAKISFTLKITDYGGGSYIIPVDQSKYSFEKINDLEIEKS